MIIPVLNEAGNLKELIHRIKTVADDTEVIFVDDGSNDGTRQIIQSESSSNPMIKFVFNKKRLGHMGSYLLGIQKATSHNIVIMDGDLQHPPEALSDFLFALQKGFEIVIGTRFLNGRFIGNRKFLRGVISRIADLTLKIAVPICRHISDPVSGFIAFNREVTTIPVSPDMKGNKLLPFLLVANRNAKIGYVPYKFSERKSGESKIVSSGSSYVRHFLREVMDIREVAAEYASRMN